MKTVVFTTETGEENCLAFNPGETIDDVLDRAPVEWSFVEVYDPDDAYQRAQELWDRDEYDLY